MGPSIAFALVLAAAAADPDGVLPGKPLGALLGQSSLAFTGFPAAHGADGPCGKATAYWRVRDVLRGDKALRGQVVPIYGAAPPSLEARTTAIFLKGRADCPELLWQQEIGGDAITRSAERPNDCELQLQVVSRVLSGLANDCDADEDCAVSSFHPNSCERPRPYSTRASTALPAWWKALADRSRKACAPQWSRQPACAPIVMQAHCHEHVCLEGPGAGKSPPFARATLAEGCAPTDAAAMTVTVRPAGAEYPQLGASWWRGAQPVRGSPGTFEAGSGEGFLATYCPAAGACQPLREVTLRVKLHAGGKGEVEVHGLTPAGEKIDANVPAEFGPSRRVVCG